MKSRKFLVIEERCGCLCNTGFIENADRREAVLVDAPFGSFEVSKEILAPGKINVNVLDGDEVNVRGWLDILC